jgi:hypothetical protein
MSMFDYVGSATSWPLASPWYPPNLHARIPNTIEHDAIITSSISTSVLHQPSLLHHTSVKHAPKTQTPLSIPTLFLAYVTLPSLPTKCYDAIPSRPSWILLCVRQKPLFPCCFPVFFLLCMYTEMCIISLVDIIFQWLAYRLFPHKFCLVLVSR